MSWKALLLSLLLLVSICSNVQARQYHVQPCAMHICHLRHLRIPHLTLDDGSHSFCLTHVHPYYTPGCICLQIVDTEASSLHPSLSLKPVQ